MEEIVPHPSQNAYLEVGAACLLHFMRARDLVVDLGDSSAPWRAEYTAIFEGCSNFGHRSDAALPFPVEVVPAVAREGVNRAGRQANGIAGSGVDTGSVRSPKTSMS